jgi:Ion transport protein
VALGSLAGVILQMFDLRFGIKGVVTVLRSFRVFRLLRLLRRGGRNLYMIFNTFVITITALSNIGGLLLLITYMYSVLGMILLGHIKRNGLMNSYMNFENFWNAFITLFTVTTGDSWNAT